MQLNERKKQADRRQSTILKITVGGHKFYISYSLFSEDSQDVSEIFITTNKHGTTLEGILTDFAILFSIALQNGISLDDLAEALKDSDYPPAGMASNKIKCRSIPDMVIKTIKRDIASRFKKRALPEQKK